MATLPIININGTSAESLFDEYIEASRLLRKADIFLRESTTCHGRDFQFNPAGDYDKAKQERYDMFQKLNDVLNYCEKWVENAENNILDKSIDEAVEILF